MATPSIPSGWISNPSTGTWLVRYSGYTQHSLVLTQLRYLSARAVSLCLSEQSGHLDDGADPVRWLTYATCSSKIESVTLLASRIQRVSSGHSVSPTDIIMTCSP